MAAAAAAVSRTRLFFAQVHKKDDDDCRSLVRRRRRSLKPFSVSRLRNCRTHAHSLCELFALSRLQRGCLLLSVDLQSALAGRARPLTRSFFHSSRIFGTALANFATGGRDANGRLKSECCCCRRGRSCRRSLQPPPSNEVGWRSDAPKRTSGGCCCCCCRRRSLQRLYSTFYASRKRSVYSPHCGWGRCNSSLLLHC